MELLVSFILSLNALNDDIISSDTIYIIQTIIISAWYIVRKLKGDKNEK